MNYKSQPYIFNIASNVIASATPPEDTSVLWLDTSVEPNLYKFYNNGAWVLANDQNATYNSLLELTRKEFNVELQKKVGNDEIISRINQTAEEIKIQSNKITLEGTVTANENFKILEDGSMVSKNGTFTGKVEGSSFYTIKTSEYTYTNTDLDIMYQIVESEIPPTEEQLAKYDLDKNGIISVEDYYIVDGILGGSYGETYGRAYIEDIISINMNNSGQIITTRRINGTEITKMAINSGSIITDGGNITINGERVVTNLSGTLARFG